MFECQVVSHDLRYCTSLNDLSSQMDNKTRTVSTLILKLHILKDFVFGKMSIIKLKFKKIE